MALPRCCPTSPRWASTSSTCHPCTRSARRTARAATTPSAPARAIPGARGRSAVRRAATTRSIPTSAATPTSTRWWRPRATRAIELALDFAIQTSPDHPWLREHPEWFHRRPDGTLKYAENPPKRYQDIHNVDWDTSEREALWNALKDVVLGWCARGILAFRVDNPHTKPMPFWEWLIAEVRAVYPEAIFLAEAFTRPAPMTTLAKIGFSQSYTYFAWKNTKADLVEFVEQARSWSAFYRPNMWPNTPDILNEYLQHGGRPAFEAQARPRGDALAELRDLLGLRGVRERAGARGERGVPRLGEVRGQEAHPRRAAAAADPARERDPAGASCAAALREPDLARHPQRRSDCVCEAGRRGCRDHGRQPRSGEPLRKGCASSRRSSACRTASRPSTCSPTRATGGAPAGTTSGSRPAARM